MSERDVGKADREGDDIRGFIPTYAMINLYQFQFALQATT